MRKFTILVVFLALITFIAAGVSFRSVMLAGEEYRSSLREDNADFIFRESSKSFEQGNTERGVKALEMLVSGYKDPTYTPVAMEELARYYQDAGEYGKAVKLYQDLLKEYPDVAEKQHIEGNIRDVNEQRIRQVGSGENVVRYEVKPGDSLSKLAGEYNTTVELIKKMNDLTSDTIFVGQTLKISTAEFSVLVKKSENILLLKKDGEVFKTYPVATGEGGITPVGDFTIVNKMIEPAWTKPGAGVILPDSDEYELGKRWMGLDEPGYGIHGTNDESTIGQSVTQGCVRMKNDDVVELYNMVPTGTKVRIVNGGTDS